MERLLAIMPGPSVPIPLRYGMTALVMLVCGALALGVQLQSGFIGMFLLLPGIFIAGFLFDRGTSFFAAVLAVAIAAALMFGRPPAEYLLPLTLFAITAMGVGLVSEALRSEMRQVADSERAKTVLLHEAAHRTKNNLAILSATVRLQAKGEASTVAAALEATSRRILILAEVYDHLTFRHDAKLVNVREYLTDVCEKLMSALGGPAPVAITVDADEVYIPSSHAVPLAVIANELVTNAFKYAFPQGRAGHINVVLRSGDQLQLIVEDNGIGLQDSPEPDGVGSRITALLTQQLGGTLSYEQREPGCRVIVRAPNAAVRLTEPVPQIAAGFVFSTRSEST